MLLDGFVLLDASHVELPEDATRASLVDRQIQEIVVEDLQYFINLYSLDLSDNQVALGQLGSLTALSRLNLQCNAITEIQPLVGFGCLEVLDLSYNGIMKEGLMRLASLVKLRELYLDGNGIKSLSVNMDTFLKLEVLSLHDNKLYGTETLLALGSIPKLKKLNLSRNRFKRVPMKVVKRKNKQGFERLTYLNLADNVVQKEEDLEAVVEMHALRDLLIYGNPVAQAAVLSTDKSMLAYDPVPSITYLEDGSERDIHIVAAYPKEERVEGTIKSYAGFTLEKVKKDNIPLNWEFRARGHKMLLDSMFDPEEMFTHPAIDIIENKTGASKPSMANEQDTVFLTSVGLHNDAMDSRIEQLLESDSTASLFTRQFTQARTIDQSKLRVAMSALRHHLKNPVLSIDHEVDMNAHKGTISSKMRKKVHLEKR